LKVARMNRNINGDTTVLVSRLVALVLSLSDKFKIWRLVPLVSFVSKSWQLLHLG
jgi:hypothetical protein